ncbi:FG-GAP-like repeat-containing protein [Stigmatella sp. ncwal1]|uniref:FG-GAP-like repeat-containing protein n=1 Tax=Stigmatella ashevillensis TaxID=2995309 RepID=A0ABT5DFJ7_9BACT|nr:FG-GAP-like repeat-containing protein [Stigmatella ashevillena]MDC0711573.1 FG-GAP-like repeat-containing protein [Stigmatella ashevillena]
MPTRLSLALLLLSLAAACIDGHPPINVGELKQVPDAARSTVEVVPASGIPADGVSTARVIITVRDRSGKVLKGQAVAFSATGTDNLLVPPPETDALGVAEGTLASTRAETKVLTVTAGTGSEQVTLAQQPEVTFVPGNSGLSFLTQPPPVSAAGALFSPAVQVRVEDSSGNVPLEPVEVTLVLESVSGGTVLDGSPVQTTTGGTAAFSNLEVRKAGTGYRLRASAPRYASVLSEPFDIVAGAVDPSKTTVVVEPSKLTVVADGEDFTSITLTARDAFGNPVAGQTIGFSVTGTLNVLLPTGGVTGADGTFTTKLSSTKAEQKTVEAVMAGTVLPPHPTVTFVPGPPARLAFRTEPPDTTLVGQPLTPAVQVQVFDAHGNAVQTSGLAVTLTLVASNGATLQGMAARTTATGVATFDDLSIQQPGVGYLLNASAGSLPGVQSEPFDIVSTVPSIEKTTVEVSKSPVVADGVDSTVITVTVRDAFGNSLGGQPVGLAVTGVDNVLSSTGGTTGADGRFSATLRSTKAELKTVEATLGTTVLPPHPEVLFVPGPPAQLVFATQPPDTTPVGQTLTPAVRVQVFDAHGNTVQTSSLAVTLTLVAPNGATLLGTGVRTTALGVATFDDLSIQQPGVGYLLSASAGSLPVVQSEPFDIATLDPSLDQTTVEVSKSPVVADDVDTTTLTVTAKDAFGNPVAGQAVGVTVSGTNNTLSSAGGTTGADGRFSATLRSTRAEAKQVHATLNGAAVAQSPQVVFIAGPAQKLVFFTQPPSSVTAGSPLETVVQVRDAHDNVATAATGPVAMGLEISQGATLQGTTSQVPSSGLATFNDLSIQQAGGGYQLRATSTGLVPAVSDPFAITASVPALITSSLTITPATPVPADNTAQATLLVKVRDAYGNAVVGVPVSLTVSGLGNTLDASSGASNTAGEFVARLKSTRAEVKSVQAQVGSLALDPKNVTFSSGPVHQLVLTAVPTELEADGVAQTFLTATAEDSFGNRIPGLEIVFSASGTQNTFTVPLGTTDGDGQLLSQLSSQTSGVKTVNATGGGKVGSVAVTFLRPGAQVSNPHLPVNPAEGCVTVEYTVSQPQSARATVLIEYESEGVFKRVTQAGSLTGSGLQGITTSPTGTTHAFLWNSTADVPFADAQTRMRFTAQVSGALPSSVILEGVNLRNGLRFEPPGTVPAGPHAQRMGRADLDGDGRMDLVVGSATSSELQVLKGNGLGSFGAPTAVSLGAGENAQALLVADINRDGKPDVLVASSSKKVFLVNGQATGLGTPSLVATLSGVARGLAVGDFNRDGRLDWAGATDAGTVETVLGTASGFAAPSVSTVGGTPGALAAGDFNRDDRLDLAFGDPAGDVQVMLGMGSGSFGAAAPLGVGLGTVALVVTELNRDGQLDLVVARGTQGLVSVAQGNGNGTFSVLPPVNTGGTPSDVVVEDLDGNGHPDVVVAGVGNAVLVLKGRGDGSLAPTPMSVPAGGANAAVVVVDADLSGRPDVVAALGSSGVSVLLNTRADRCEGFIEAARQLAVSSKPSAAVTPDIDGDGRPDLVVASEGNSSLDIARGLGNGTFTAFTSVPIGTGATNPQGLTSGDFNGDGRVDLVTANLNTGNVSLLLDNGAGGYTPSTLSSGSSPRGVATADFDQDGHLDIVAANSGASNVRVFYGNGDGTFGESKTHATGSTPYAVLVVDLNGDGRPDIATANSGASNVTSLRNDGARAFTSLGATLVRPGPRSLDTADFNRDNKPDLVVGNYSDDSVSVLLGQGNGTFAPAINTTANVNNKEFRQPRGVAVGDFNLDGWPDVAVSSNLGYSMAVLLGKPVDATGTYSAFTISSILAAGTSVGSLTGVDLDGDGRQDLVATLSAYNRVAVLRGTGSSVMGTRAYNVLDVTGTADSHGALAADVNRDGKLDLLVANTTSPSVSLLLNDGSGHFPALRRHTASSGAVAVAVGDVNRDGKPDMLVANSTGNSITVHLGDGTGAVESTASRASSSPRYLALVDVDLDGDLDIVAGGSGVSVHLNDGSGTFGNAVAMPSSGGTPRSGVVADFNQDGRLDMAFANNSTTTSVGVMLGSATGTAFGAPKAVNLGAYCSGLAMGDFDQDGKLDLAAACSVSGTGVNANVRVLKGQGNGNFTLQTTLSLPSDGAMEGVVIADLDGDGRLDVAGVATTTASMVVWRGNGAGGFGAPTSWASVGGGQSLASGDFNGDGLVDAFTGGDSQAGVMLGR